MIQRCVYELKKIIHPQCVNLNGSLLKINFIFLTSTILVTYMQMNTFLNKTPGKKLIKGGFQFHVTAIVLYKCSTFKF